MSLRAVTYHEAACDDCGLKTADLWGDFSAWADSSTALDEWLNADGFDGPEGMFCYHCRPRCLCGCAPNSDDWDEWCACDTCPEHAEGGESR